MAVFSETIQLKDEVSAAANKAAGAVDGLAKGTEKTQRSLLDASSAMQIGKTVLGGLADGFMNAGAAIIQGDIIGGISGMVDGIASAAKALDLLLPGLGEAVSAIISFAGGAVTLTLKLAQFAIASTEAKQASISLWDAMGGGVTSGEEIDGMLDGLREKLGVTKDDLGKYATKFLQMGVNGKEALETLTTAAVSAEAIVKGGGDAFAKMQLQIDAAAESGGKFSMPLNKLTKRLSDMGLNAGDVAKRLGMTTAGFQKGIAAGTIDAKKFGDALSDAAINKGAGPLERMSNSVGNLGKMFKEYLVDIFEDMGKQIAPLMKQVKSLFETFSQAQPSGQAIRAGLVAGLTKVFEVATMLVPIVKHFFLDLIIYALKAYIALKPIVQTIRDFAASAEGSAVLTEIFNGLIYAAEVMGVVLLVVVAVVGVLAAVLIGMQVAIVAVGGIILGFVADAGAALTGWAGSAVTAAYNFIAGLVSGIAGGASKVVAAVTGLADGAVGAFKKKLLIGSPSRVMMQLGDYTGTGFAMGLEDAGPDVHAAASGVASSAVAGASSSGDAGAAGKSSGAGNTWNINVQIDGAGKDAASITREMVSSVFESMALTAGV